MLLKPRNAKIEGSRKASLPEKGADLTQKEWRWLQEDRSEERAADRDEWLTGRRAYGRQAIGRVALRTSQNRN